jgi:ferredoxin-NADP reductase
VPLKHVHRKYETTGFATQTGKVELYSELLHRHGYPAVPRFIEPAEQRDEAFPLTLFSANSGYFCHSQHRCINALRRKRAEPTAEIHPELARRKDILEGDWMFVHSRKGTIRMRVAFNEALAQDVVASDYGWWQPAPDLGLPGYLPDETRPIGASFNAIISESRDPLSGSLALRSFACDVARDESTAWQGWRSFIVAERREEGTTVVALTLRPVDGGSIPAFRPGQYVSLRIGGASRSYSLTGAAIPAPDAYRIGVRHIEGGQVSTAISNMLSPGDTVELQPPEGGFVLPSRNEFPVVLIAGGIGITPFLSYLETLEGTADEPHVTLHYGCRDDESRPFQQRLEALRQRLPNLTLVMHLSRPQSGDHFDRLGRFTVSDIDAELLRKRARIYMCASDAMMEEVSAGLQVRGVPAFEIFKERFRSSAPPVLDGLMSRQIHFARSGRTLTWSPQAPLASILAVAESAGIAIPSGCRVGQCESCAVPIKTGEVRHLVDCSELDEGHCLTCQAVPVSDLVIDA